MAQNKHGIQRTEQGVIDNCPTDFPDSFVLPGSGHGPVYCIYSETLCKGKNEESERKYD